MSATLEFAQDLNMEELHSLQTSKEHVEKANAFRTIPAGAYRLIPQSVKVANADENAPIPGRLDISVRYDAFAKEDSTKRIGSVWAHYSPELHYFTPRDGGAPVIDKQAKLWGQAAKAFDMVNDPAMAIIQAIASYPLDGFVSEYIKMPDNTFLTPKSAEERTKAIGDGGVPGNSLVSVGKVK